MARINAGIPPVFLSDQHLIAESVEITMITGALRKDGGIIKGSVPEKFGLGKGHINFFKPKLTYLKNRLQAVNIEMMNRGFATSTKVEPDEFKGHLRANWKPTFRDSIEVRMRIVDRLKNPLKANGNFHKYYGKPIEDMEKFCDALTKSKLNIV